MPAAIRIVFAIATMLAIAAAPATATATTEGGTLSLDFRYDFGKRIDTREGRTNYPSNLAVDQDTGDVYVMDLYFNRIHRFDKDGNFISMFTSNRSLGLAYSTFDDSLWVAAWKADEIRKFDQDGNLLLTLGGTAGTGPGEFDFPHDVAVHPTTGEIYVLDTDNARVQILDQDGNYLREWPLGGNPQQPFGIEIDPTGSWCAISNSGNREVLKYTVDGTLLASWWRPGSAPGEFRWPRDIAIDADGDILVADTDNERAQRLDSDGNFLAWVLGPNDRENGEFHPRAIEVHRASGMVYAAAAYAHRVDRIDADGNYIDSFGMRTRSGPVFNLIKGIAIAPGSGEVYVSDWLDHRIKRFDREGRYLGQFDAWIEEQTYLDGTPIPESFPNDPTTRMWVVKEDQAFPAGITIDQEGKVWMIRGSMHYEDDPRLQADWLVRRWTETGEFISGFGHEDFPRTSKVRDLTVDSVNERLYVVNSDAHLLMKFDYDGNLIWKVGGLGSTPGKMNYPTGVALDLDQGRVYVCDAGNDQIHVFSTAGEYLFRFGSPGTGDGQLRISDFSHMAFDPKGYLFVADTGNNRVAVFDRNGNWVTSMGEPGYGGNGKYAGFTALAVQDGLLYVGDNAGYEIEVYQIRYPE